VTAKPPVVGCAVGSCCIQAANRGHRRM